MNKKTINQNGSLEVLIILITITLLVIGGVGYFVYHAKHKTVPPIKSASHVPSIVKVTGFTSNQAVFDSIGTAIENSGFHVRLVRKTAIVEPIKQFQDTSKVGADETTYIDASEFRIALPCPNTCTVQENSESEIASSSRKVTDITVQQLLSSIKSDLLHHNGVRYVSEGEMPGTYVTHYYLVISLTINNLLEKVQVVFNGGDSGNYISAYIYK